MAQCALPLYPRVVWRSRGGELDIRACGSAIQLDLTDLECGSKVLQELEIDPAGDLGKSLSWFQWERFEPDAEPAEEWKSYGSRRVLVPAMELRRQKDRCFFGINRAAGQTDTLRRALGQLVRRERTELRAIGEQPSVTRDQWSRQVESVQEAIALQPDLQKVVLARLLRFEVAEFSPEDFLDATAALQPDSYRFLIEPAPGTAFFGLTPERLFLRRQGTVQSEALAGTRPRGATTEESDAMGRELMESNKDRREQGIVLRQIVKALEPLAGQLSFDEQPTLRILTEVQHLQSSVSGVLNSGVTDGDLLAALQPTPAVAGQPRRPAQRVIAEIEEFDRGLYAGPVGCCSVQETEFAVAIRSALWHGNTLRLYAGAGILPQSSAVAEWDETKEKLRLLRGLIEDAVHEV